jgi:hypothetical protein
MIDELLSVLDTKTQKKNCLGSGKYYQPNIALCCQWKQFIISAALSFHL